MDERVNVNIFFPKLGSSGDSNNFFNLQPVRRVVDRVRPIRPAIMELLNGPTPQEQRQGFFRLDTDGLSIGFLARDGNQLRLDLVTDGTKQFETLEALIALGAALNTTVMQFPSIEIFEVTLDGERLPEDAV